MIDMLILYLKGILALYYEVMDFIYVYLPVIFIFE